MEQYHSIMASGVTPENMCDMPAAPYTPVWPSEAEVGDPDSEGEENDKEAREARTEASIDAMFQRYIDQKPDGKLTKETIRRVFEELDDEFANKADQRKLPTSKGTVGNDASEIYSPPRIAEMAAATGLRQGWSLD